jgi:hypothetical protein
MKKLLAVLMIPVVLLSGCFLTKPSAQPYIQAAVLIAVGTAEAKGISAVEINAIAKAALAADTGASATLTTIAGLINAQIAKLGLPAADLAAANILEAALAAAIEAKINGSTTLAQTQAAIADVLNYVIADTGGVSLKATLYHR